MNEKPAKQHHRITRAAEILAAAIVLSGPLSVLFMQPAASDGNHTADSVIAAHGLPFNEAACQTGGPRVAHAENFTYFFFKPQDDTGLPNFNKHAQTAAQILYDRFNERRQECQQVTLLDIDPFAETSATATVFSQFDVVTISSFKNLIVNRNPAPAPEPESEPVTAPVPPPPTPEPSSPPAAGGTTGEERSALNRNFQFSADFWDNQSETIIVASPGNEGSFRDGLKSIFITHLQQADTLITTGALTPNGRVAGYSSDTAPDLVWYTAFGQNFCYPYTAGPQEIRFYSSQLDIPVNEADFPQGPIDESCNLIGTSFSVPDQGGFIAQAVQEHPKLSSHEITVAAYLATARIDGVSFTNNARGKWFNDVDAGHGAFMPDVFFHLLDQLDYYKQENGAQNEMARTSPHLTYITDTAVSLTFSGDLTAIRTIAALDFEKLDVEGRTVVIDHFPDTITITSPEGTTYNLPLTMYKEQPDGDAVRAGFSVSAFLGENAKGRWRIEAPEGYVLKNADLTHVGALPSTGNTIDWLVNYALDWHQQNPDIRTATAPEPWTRHAEQAAGNAARPTPSFN